jgi:PqqD family protein of HPr-rel-A system
VWRLLPGQSLAHRGWDDEYVVYNDLSGDTHLLGADAMAVLLALRAAPCDEAALAAGLGADSAAEREILSVLLAELRALALVEEA